MTRLAVAAPAALFVVLLAGSCGSKTRVAEPRESRPAPTTVAAPEPPPAPAPTPPTPSTRAKAPPRPAPPAPTTPPSPARPHSSPPPLAQPLRLGFQDDESFRWGPDRIAMLDKAGRAHASVIRTNVYWWQIAPRRPATPRDPFDPTYRLDDLDELVRNAQQRGLSVMLTIWGTPKWANGGLAPNHPPTRAAELADFAHALALRYSGRFAGFPYVGYYSVWNEPNLEQFLAPQFDAGGRPVAPALYARLYRAAYGGIKSGNPRALVAIGETSPRGRDHVTSGRAQQSESPGRFAELLARAAPRVRFDAWAHHPYPIVPSRPPSQRARWPNVSLRELPRFERRLDRWFRRDTVPIWITEYAYQSRPPGTLGVSVAAQSQYLRQALTQLARDPRVRMILWFTFRDEPSNAWKSGLLTEAGTPKPAYRAFSGVAGALAGRNETVPVSSRSGVQRVRLPALGVAYYAGVGARLGLTYRVLAARRLLTVDQALVTIERDGSVIVPVRFHPLPGRRYVLQVSGTDAHGNALQARRVLVAVR